MKKIALSAALAMSMGCQMTPKPMAHHPSNPEVAPFSADPSRYPADISRVSDGYRVEECYSGRSGQVYQIAVNGSDANQGGRFDSDGCFKTTFRDGRLKPGDNVVVRVDGRNIDSQTVPGGNGGGSSGGGSSTPVPAPVPQVPRADLSNVRTTAENNARCMANAVVESYGQVERFRYNYYRGLREGIALYNFSNLGSYNNSAHYLAGHRQGTHDGQSSGFEKGRTEGTDDGFSRGRSDAIARFSAVVDTGNPPQRDLTVPPSGFSGVAVNQPVRSLETRLSDLDGDLRSWLGTQRFEYDGWRYSYSSDYWSASRLYGWQNNYQFELVNSWYRSNWAFDLWQGRQFSRCSDQVDYYYKLADSSRTGNSSDAVSTFQRAFVSEYDQVIGSKWRNAVTRNEPVASSFGRAQGVRVAEDYARDMGYSHGFTSSYSRSSVEGHFETFDSSYQASFRKNFDFYESNAVPSSVSGTFVTNNSAQRFGAGSPVKLVIKQAVNLGMKEGTFLVTLKGNSLPGPAKALTLNRSESLKQEVTLENLGRVGFEVKPGAQTSITANIGNQSISHTFNLDWTATVFNLGMMDAGDLRNTSLAYVKQQLATEFENMKGTFKKNLYGDKVRDNTLLEQFVNTYETPTTDARFRAGIKALAPNLKTSIGERPRGLLGGGKKEWDAAAALYDRLAQ